ncbi:MAG TPA: glucose-6-phosphate dehydrogenase [Acidimicrobiia bacterium]|nr:glucose-6-phosphate dehydrogenase [Acidimicrobiia bacterium]
MTESRYTPEALSVDIDPHLFVVFGGTGDLARSKLLPALYRLLSSRGFSDSVQLLGVASRDITDDEYRSLVGAALAAADLAVDEEWLGHSVHFQSLRHGFEALGERIREVEEAAGLGGNRAFYLAVPPDVFDETVEGLGKVGVVDGPGWSRVVVEKPFGVDSSTGMGLNQLLHRWFAEEQIYRIDHYLAKETVRNLLALRFANPIFESSWTRDRISSVQITVAESGGIGTRARYYDSAGAVRDIIQNHALQIFSLVAMEPPVRASAQYIRDEKVKLLKATAAVTRPDLVRGQYTAGRIEGEDVAGYRDEEGIPPDSTTETYAALVLHVDNWRWKGVPFYLRAGKRLATRVTQVSVVFKEPPVSLFSVVDRCEMHPNVFEIRLQPSEGFALSFEMKVPGEGYVLQTQRLRFDYDEVFGELPDAYETLLADVMTGDQTLFVRADEVEEAWRIVEPALGIEDAPQSYEAGSWGPAGADDLLARRGDHWEIPVI